VLHALGTTFALCPGASTKSGLKEAEREAGVARRAAAVDAPPGGWPTLSVVVLNPTSKAADRFAIDQLAEQDYPVDQIREILVRDAEGFKDSAPQAFRPLLRELADASNANVLVASQLEACSGDMVAVWGDDQISTPSRLSAQVAASVAGDAPTVLKWRWFYDTLDRDFVNIDEWEVEMFESFEASLKMVTPSNDTSSNSITGMTNRTVPVGLGELIVACDALTLCGSRETLAGAAEKLRPKESPTDELKGLLTVLLKDSRPQILDGLEWASLASPPLGAKFELDKPEIALRRLADAAVPKRSAEQAVTMLDKTIVTIRESNMKPSDAVRLCLDKSPSEVPSELELKRLGTALTATLERSTGADAHKALLVLSGWPGIQPGQGGKEVLNLLPIFYSAYVAIREYVRENGDLMTMDELGPLAEEFVKLAQLMLGSDVKVQERVVFYAQQDLLRTGGGMEMGSSDSTADIIKSVGLRECLTNVGYAAQEHPGVRFNVAAVASLAKALAEANVVNKALSTKVAKAVIADADKLRPPDIGKLFVALHERKWFTDPMAEGYLTEAMVAQIQNLKKEDQGLEQIVKDSVKEQEAAAAT
jgi:hypothetical protein